MTDMQKQIDDLWAEVRRLRAEVEARPRAELRLTGPSTEALEGELRRTLTSLEHKSSP